MNDATLTQFWLKFPEIPEANSRDAQDLIRRQYVLSRRV
jgi:hypothetical protein